MTARRWIGPGAVAFFIMWLGLLLAGRDRFFRDPGTFWHTVVGDRILHDGFFRTDPFTFTFGGARWIPHQWLGEVAMSLAHRVGGFDGLLVGTAAVLAAAWAWPAARLLRTGLHPVLVGVVVLLSVAAGASHFHCRPHVTTIAGVSITAMLLTDADAGRVPPRRLWWLVPVYVVWANCHGGMLGGLGMLALIAGTWTVFWALGPKFGVPTPVKGWRDVMTLAAVGVGCGATAFVNPYGVELPEAWFGIMGSPVLPQLIQEHAPLKLSDPTAWPLLAFAGVYVFVVAGRPGVRVTWLLLPTFWLFQSFDRVRHAPLFAVTGLVAVAAMWPHTRWAAGLATRRPDFQAAADPTTLRFWPNVGPAVLAVVAGFLVASLGVGWARLDPATWPVGLTDTLRANEPHGAGGDKLFNEYLDGGFVIYHAPGYRVFVDDRCELFGDEFLQAHNRAEAVGTADAVAAWEAMYGRFDWALVRDGSGYDRYFASAPGWECVGRAGVGAFYQRR